MRAGAVAVAMLVRHRRGVSVRAGLVVVALCLLAGALSADALAATAGPRSASSPKAVRKQSGSVAPPSRSVTYRDAADDVAPAPDISQIVASLAGNRLTFRIGIADLGAGLVDGEVVSVSINTDRNWSRGCDGAEVSLAVLGETFGTGFARWGRCVGGSWKFDVRQGSFVYSEGSGAVSFALNASDVGTTNFTFVVDTMYEDPEYYDEAGPLSFASSQPPAIPPGRPRSSTERIAVALTALARAPAATANIEHVVVSRSADDVISFRIEFAEPVVLADDTTVQVAIDVDRDTGTGIDGLDYALDWTGYGSLLTAEDGDEVETEPESLEFDHTGATVTFSIAAADIGSPRRFDFYTFIEQDGHTDIAPVHVLFSDTWTYPKDDLQAGGDYPTERYEDLVDGSLSEGTWGIGTIATVAGSLLALGALVALAGWGIERYRKRRRQQRAA